MFSKLDKLILENDSDFLNYYIKGDKTNYKQIEILRDHPLLSDLYEFFIDQREEYDIANTLSLDDQEISN